MTHYLNEPSSSQTSHNSMSKLIIASDTGNTNKALQPGTPFLLQGCMCQEGDGVIVVKVNWRDKTYTGSLMDMEQYPWATPKHVEIADLGSPLEKELRFSPRLKLNPTKQNPCTSQDIEEQQPKEDDIVMSPQSSEMVESEEGKSPDIPRQILPKLTNCTELNRTNITSFMDVDDKRGLFAPRSKQNTLGLLSSPSTSLTDLKAESEKKKNHDLLTGLTHPKEVVIPSILGDNILPFDTTCREKANLNIEIKEELKDDIISRPMIVSTKLNKSSDLPKREGFAPTNPIMPQYTMYNLAVPPALLNMQHLDQKQKIVKPIPDKPSLTADQIHQFHGEFIHKQESISPKSSTSGSPNESKQQKKRKTENNYDYSIPKRPETLALNNSTDHLPSFTTPDLSSKSHQRIDEPPNIRTHIPVNKSASLPHQNSTSPNTHPPKPHNERKQFNTTPEFVLSAKEGYPGMKLHRDNNVKERPEKHMAYAPPQPLPHTYPPNRGEKMRLEKKPKRPREGESPSDHNIDIVSKANHHAFLPTPIDSKIPNLMAPSIKIEPQPSYFPTPDMLSLFSYPLLVPGIQSFAEQHKFMQAQVNATQEVKVEAEKSKSKPTSNNKSKSQPKLQLPVNYEYFQQPGHHLPMNPPVLTPNNLALFMNQNVPMGMLPKEAASGIGLPGIPILVDQDKEKIRPQVYSQPNVHQLKQKAQTPQSNSTRKIPEKQMSHDTAIDEHAFQMQEFMKQQLNAQHQQLLKHQEVVNANNIEHNNNTLNIGQPFKHKSTPTSSTNNKITTTQPNHSLAMLNPNQQVKGHNGMYPSLIPFVAMTPDMHHQMGLFGNFPFQTQMDPTLPIPIPLFDPLTMRLPQAQVQPDTLDSKW